MARSPLPALGSRGSLSRNGRSPLPMQETCKEVPIQVHHKAKGKGHGKNIVPGALNQPVNSYYQHWSPLVHNPDTASPNLGWSCLHSAAGTKPSDIATAVKAEHPQVELSCHSWSINLTLGEGVQQWVEK